MSKKNLNFFDEYPAFYETGTTGAGAKVLNLRFTPLIGNNLELLKDATVLDIASHDGRWSFAALKNGAKKVYGIEGKKELVQSSIENMKKYGIDEEKYNFVTGDIFEEIKKIPINKIDVVFCLGIFYHISSHMELLKEIKKLNPKYLILDTEITNSKSSIIRIREEPYHTPDKLLSYEKFVAGRISRSALNIMLKALDFKFRYYNWENDIRDWKGIEIYSSKKSILVKRALLYILSFVGSKKTKIRRRNDLVRYYTTKKVILIAKNQTYSK
jgi:16S rRNA G966 N2-methylase RsmD